MKDENRGRWERNPLAFGRGSSVYTKEGKKGMCLERMPLHFHFSPQRIPLPTTVIPTNTWKIIRDHPPKLRINKYREISYKSRNPSSVLRLRRPFWGDSSFTLFVLTSLKVRISKNGGINIIDLFFQQLSRFIILKGVIEPIVVSQYYNPRWTEDQGY